MHLYLTARHFSLTDQIRQHVERRIVDSLRAHADPHDLNRVEVQLESGQRDARFSCHVLLQLSGQRDINITEHDHDLYAAIDLAEKRLLTALVAERQKRLTVDRRPPRKGSD
jgi:ribosomal subunit interface protein